MTSYDAVSEAYSIVSQQQGCTPGDVAIKMGVAPEAAVRLILDMVAEGWLTEENLMLSTAGRPNARVDDGGILVLTKKIAPFEPYLPRKVPKSFLAKMRPKS